jgi:hypothetical protein
MPIAEFIQKSRMLVCIAGLLIDGVAMLGVAFHAVRSRLRAKSPIELQSLGAAIFFAGAIAARMAGAFK